MKKTVSIVLICLIIMAGVPEKLCMGRGIIGIGI